MEHNPQRESHRPSTSSGAKKSGKSVNLRPFLRLRLGLFALALAFGLLYVGGMTFGNGTIEAPEPTDPAVAQSAWQELVSETLADKRPDEQPMSLPTSQHPSIGLLPVRAGN